MIPTSNFEIDDFEVIEQPSYTYKMHMDSERINGYVDGLEAIRQAIYKILSTERYAYIMYSPDYGIELVDLYGEPVEYACSELERRIAEALTQDDRINAVSDFEFDISNGTILVSFVVQTIYGNTTIQQEVSV